MATPTRTGRLWLSAAITAGCLTTLLATLPEPSSPLSAAPAAAWQVQIDPQTGDLVPVTGLDKAALAAGMARMLSRSDRGLQRSTHADGGVSVDLAGRFGSLSVASIDSSGVVRTGCVTTDAELANFLAGPAADGSDHGLGR